MVRFDFFLYCTEQKKKTVIKFSIFGGFEESASGYYVMPINSFKDYGTKNRHDIACLSFVHLAEGGKATSPAREGRPRSHEPRGKSPNPVEWSPIPVEEVFLKKRYQILKFLDN